jgi:hypothetical protein
VKPFATALHEIAAGAAADRASRLLQELVTAVAETGKKGTLTVLVTVQPYKAGGTLDVTAKVTSKPPQDIEAEVSGIFYHDKAGNLRRENPNQPPLPIRGLQSAKEMSA